MDPYKRSKQPVLAKRLFYYRYANGLCLCKIMGNEHVI